MCRTFDHCVTEYGGKTISSFKEHVQPLAWAGGGGSCHLTPPEEIDLFLHHFLTDFNNFGTVEKYGSNRIFSIHIITWSYHVITSSQSDSEAKVTVLVRFWFCCFSLIGMVISMQLSLLDSVWSLQMFQVRNLPDPRGFPRGYYLVCG